ncbi:rho GTPase-activating protein 19-like [Dreissena polymorpha]|uniref:rho GTPase-activating protein 19-like n=1 Tax=Dreissena polymorpha TaxID=45954 RepID=UPI002263F860|nr:rho GTPase-activating protein 19-like [Dreissena polymorpha]
MVVWSDQDTAFLQTISTANDMSGGCDSRRGGQTDAEKNVNRLRNVMPEKLATFCKMHLSFLLELDGSKLEEIFMEQGTTDCNSNKRKPSTPFSKKKGNYYPAPLSKDLSDAMSRLISFLQQPDCLRTEGLFRKTGNVSRQRLLREWIAQGADDLHLGDGTFSPHDVATVLKQLLSEMPEPLLTQKHYEAHMQISEMSRNCLSDREKKRAHEKQVKALQLLVQLLPRENAALLESLLDLLNRAAKVVENKMSAGSLGVVFAPSLICPRKMVPEAMQAVAGTLSKAVAMMIENSAVMFAVPRELAADVANFWREMEDPNLDVFDGGKSCEDVTNIRKAKYGSSSAVNTVLTFAERKSPEEFDCSQDTQVALAQLYAHVQSMPESAKKKKLLKQFNRAGNMHNHTPKKGKHSRSRTFGESIKKHFSMLSKTSKSHEICDSKSGDELRLNLTKAISIDDTVANITYTMTPDNKLKPLLRHSPAVHVVDLGASPCNVKPRKRLSDENMDPQVGAAKSLYRPPTPCKTLFPNTPLSVARPVAMVSPITKTSEGAVPGVTKKAMLAPLTPCNRLPMMVITPSKSYIESVL